MAEAKYLSHPQSSRLFVQEGAGKPWNWVGCVEVSGVQVSPQQIEYARCVTENGIVTTTIPRVQNPTPFQVKFADNYVKWQSLHKSMVDRGCKPNFFMASVDCRDANRVSDPNYNTNGLMLYGISLSGSYQYYGGISIHRDPNQSTDRMDQLEFVSSDTNAPWVRKNTYALQALIQNGPSASSVPAASIAVVDKGECQDYICGGCDNTGCQKLLINNGVDFFYTLDGGSVWTRVFGSGEGVAQAFGGVAFAVKASDIRRYPALDASSTNWADWTVATTDVAFAGVTGIAAVDPRILVAGGTDGAVWRSSDSGGSWKQIRAPLVTTANYYNFKAIGVNDVLKQVVAVGASAANAVYIQISTDRGKTWIQVGAALSGKTWAGSSHAEILQSDAITYVIVDGDLYRIWCASGTYTYEKVSVSGASGNITGIGMADPTNPNILLLTVWDGVTGKVVKTVDGFATSSIETLPFTISAGDVAANPMVACHSKYGDSLLFAFGSDLYYARDWDSFFVGD